MLRKEKKLITKINRHIREIEINLNTYTFMTLPLLIVCTRFIYQIFSALHNRDSRNLLNELTTFCITLPLLLIEWILITDIASRFEEVYSKFPPSRMGGGIYDLSDDVIKLSTFTKKIAITCHQDANLMLFNLKVRRKDIENLSCNKFYFLAGQKLQNFNLSGDHSLYRFFQRDGDRVLTKKILNYVNADLPAFK